MENQDVKTAYENAKSDIANLLGWFECELQKEPEIIQWPRVGTLNHVRQNLIETLSFLSGFETREIENSLEESRM
ncbi:MAG: hypothetical protein ISS71_06030 [Phycisphaerae bacterium]|nr:hypothetical protein [Phycisphaerae bacterium]